MAHGQGQNPKSNPQNPADPEKERVRGTQLDQDKDSPGQPQQQDRGQAQQGGRQSGAQDRPQAGKQDTQHRSGGGST